MRQASLRGRIRNGTLLMLALAVALGSLGVVTVHRLGGAIRETLYRNYISIEAAGHMHEAVYRLEIDLARGTLESDLAADRELFRHWIQVELKDITEPGEGSLAHSIEARGRRVFDQAGHSAAPTPADLSALHDLLDRLIALNQAAMFRADSHASRMADQLAFELTGGLFLLLLLGALLSWTQAWLVARPLTELTDRLRSFSLRGPSLRLGEQPLVELQAVADEFNRMAERLEQFERMNVDRIVYEKGKTEAIVESLEDGIVLIDPSGIVTHINEVGGIVLGIERDEALGSPFDDLSSTSPARSATDRGRFACARARPQLCLQADTTAAGRDAVLRHVAGDARYHLSTRSGSRAHQSGGDAFA